MDNAEEKPVRNDGLKPGIRYPLILQVCVDLSSMLPRPFALNQRKCVLLLLMLNTLFLTPVALVIGSDIVITIDLEARDNSTSLMTALATLVPVAGLAILVTALALYGLQKALAGKASFFGVLAGATFGVIPVTVWALICYLILLLLLSMSMGRNFDIASDDPRVLLVNAIGGIMIVLGPIVLFCAICWALVDSIALLKEITGIRVQGAIVLVVVEVGTLFLVLTVLAPLVVSVFVW
jgi:hypothetical protein